MQGQKVLKEAKLYNGEATGVYNANGLPNTLTMKDVLDECRTVSDSEASFTWASEEFLLQEQVAAWSELPLWLPESVPRLKSFMFVNCDKAVAAGLSFRPLHDTVRDTLSWYQRDRASEKLKAGLDTDKEQSLLLKRHEIQL